MKKRRKLNIAMLGLKGIPVTIGGPENFVQNISIRLVQRGHRATVYCRPYAMKLWLEQLPPEQRPQNDQTLSYEDVRLVTLPTMPTKNFDAIVHTTLSAVHGLFQPYDIINYQTVGPSMVSFISRMKDRPRVVTSVLGLDWARAKWSSIARQILKFGEYTSVKFADRTHVISQDLKRYYDNKYGIDSTYIPTGVDIKEPVPLDLCRKYGLEKEKYVLFLSRIVPEKGAHFLVEAFNRLKTEMKLVIAGNALYEKAYLNGLKRMADRNVIFTGFVPDEEMAELFSNAYLYVLPSEIEGLPHSLLQGLSYGRCVVTSDIAANLEALGGCGYSFKSRDAAALQSLLQKLMDNPELVKAESEKSIARVKRDYDWDIVVDKFEELYYQSLGM